MATQSSTVQFGMLPAGPPTHESKYSNLSLKYMFLKLSSTGASGTSDLRSKVRERWLKDLFDRADKDNSETLDLKEVLRMMNELNVGVSEKQLKKQFKVLVVYIHRTVNIQLGSYM